MINNRTRLHTTFNLDMSDRPPIMGGWLAAPTHVQELTGCSDDEYWDDPFSWGVKAEQILGSDGVIDIFAPVTRGEYRIVDGQIMEERDHMPLESVLEDIESLPTCEEQLDAFEEESAYAIFISEYQSRQSTMGSLVYCPSDWYLIPKAIPGWEYGYENAMLIIGMYPDHARKFIDFGLGRGLKLATLRARAIREGILPHAIFTGEDLCDQRGPMVSPAFLRKEYFPRLERVFEPLLEVGAKIVWHCDGNYTRLLDDVLASGVNGLQGFQRECEMDLEWIVDKRARNGDPLLIYGPMSVTRTLPYGTPEDVRAEVSWAMETCRDKASLVFFTSNTLTPDVPLENIQTLWDTVLSSAW